MYKRQALDKGGNFSEPQFLISHGDDKDSYLRAVMVLEYDKGYKVPNTEPDTQLTLNIGQPSFCVMDIKNGSGFGKCILFTSEMRQ